MKENLEFYQHFTDADQHPKFKMLRVKYGWEGEGKFWALNNRIGLAKGAWLDLSKKFNKASIATDLDFNIEQFDEFISYLEDDCELIFWDEKNECISTDTLQENYKKVMGERAASRDRKRKQKSDKIDGSPGNQKSSPEPSKSSPDQNNKPKQTKTKQIKTNKNYTVYQHCTEIFTGISDAIERINGLPKNNHKHFNARKWAVEQYRNRGHPAAILESLDGLFKSWDIVDKPYGWVNKIMITKSPNYHESDFIALQEELKDLPPNDQLSQLVSGIFKEI